MHDLLPHLLTGAAAASVPFLEIPACNLGVCAPVQAEVLALDVLQAERAVSTGHDHTCRVWKVADESQLICRAAGMALDCCRYVQLSYLPPHSSTLKLCSGLQVHALVQPADGAAGRAGGFECRVRWCRPCGWPVVHTGTAVGLQVCHGHRVAYRIIGWLAGPVDSVQEEACGSHPPRACTAQARCERSRC